MGKEEVLKELGVSQQGLAGKDVESRKEIYRFYQLRDSGDL